MARVSWTPQAAGDLEAICLFIARDAPQIAATFAGRIVTATDRLAPPVPAGSFQSWDSKTFARFSSAATESSTALARMLSRS
jgi:plasmid stabilization system protein ParE